MKCLCTFILLLITIQNFHILVYSNSNISLKTKTKQEITKNIFKNLAKGENKKFVFLDFLFKGIMGKFNENYINIWKEKDICFPFLIYLQCGNTQITKVKIKSKYLSFKYGDNFTKNINELLCLSECVDPENKFSFKRYIHSSRFTLYILVKE